jgi:FkbM family methyltransferase
LNQYTNLIHTLDDKVDNIGPWIWLKTDVGAWDGPKENWEQSHKKLILEHVPGRKLCIQAGGCLGMYPRLLSDIFHWVYTFEPDQHNFFCLAQNCQKDRIIKFQAALGAEPKRTGLNRLSEKNVGMHTIQDGDEFPVMTIDSFDYPTVDFIQLDIEGYEVEALNGAMKTIEKYKPVIMVESPRDKIADMLAPFGYKLVARSFSDGFYKV